MTYEIPAAVARRFQDTRRVEVRLQAAADAAALIRDRSQWTVADLRQLLHHLQTGLDVFVVKRTSERRPERRRAVLRLLTGVLHPLDVHRGVRGA